MVIVFFEFCVKALERMAKVMIALIFVLIGLWSLLSLTLSENCRSKFSKSSSGVSRVNKAASTNVAQSRCSCDSNRAGAGVAHHRHDDGESCQKKPSHVRGVR